MTTREALLSVHVLAAVIWVGGGFMLQILTSRAQRSEDPNVLVRMAREIEQVGPRAFVPASLLLIITGFWMIGESNFDYEFWIVFALCVWAASFLVGLLYLGPQAGRVGALIETEGAGSPAVRAKLGQLFLISRIELVFLFLLLVVVDMVVKPGL